jgi:energy-coupling factor transporter ATP-binding protein EcfA2
MRISHIELHNWKNFAQIKADLTERVFLVGPNAVGKSNLLNAFEFLRDLAAPSGGLQRAIADRGGFGRLRYVRAKRDDDIGLTIELAERQKLKWRYEIRFSLPRPNELPALTHEAVYRGTEELLIRPSAYDQLDARLLTQTALEQVQQNALFREIGDVLAGITYLHVVPQLVRNPGSVSFEKNGHEHDAYGRDLVDWIARTPAKVRTARLAVIGQALKGGVPYLSQLALERDVNGLPHLRIDYAYGSRQRSQFTEAELSDGTLRLIGLFWSLQDGRGPLLLEEPELSLHTEIIRRLPRLIYRMQSGRKRRQIIISTHSADLLSEPGIGGEEVLMLTPTRAGTDVRAAASLAHIRVLLENGLTVAQAVLPHTTPQAISNLDAVKPNLSDDHYSGSPLEKSKAGCWRIDLALPLSWACQWRVCPNSQTSSNTRSVWSLIWPGVRVRS